MMSLSLLLCCVIQAPDPPDLRVTAVPGGRYRVFQRHFTQHVDVFGVKVFGTRRVPSDKLRHVAVVMAEYLDNDEDGAVDNPKVVAEMVRRGAFMAVAESERAMERLDWGDIVDAGFEDGQGQFLAETAPSGGRFDATLEEVLHLITHVGYAGAYPSAFGERAGSELGRCLDRARGGRFGDVPAEYPDGAWFTYDDETCDYGCQCTEYLYWAITSVLGAQEAPRRRREISHEWRLYNKALVAARDPGIYALITAPKYRMPTRLPDGRYRVASEPEVQGLQSVASRRSVAPDLCVGPNGAAYLSWVEPVGRGHALRYARLQDGRWTAPREIARGGRWFVNWADFGALRVLPGGFMLAHWRQMSGAGTYDYDVMMSRSLDDGATWSAPTRPHQDGVQAEHGFVSTAVSGRDRVALAWLDGRKMNGATAERGAMTLRYAELSARGDLSRGAELDARVCECCQTAMAWTSAGPLVVYRDRSDEEVRDIACVRRVDGEWSAPRAITSEQWKIAGCPVNGPSVAAQGDVVVVAYFTAAAGRASVRLIWSLDAGATFGAPLVVDDEDPPGRVEVLLAGDGAAWLCWLGRDEDAGAVLLRRVAPSGAMSDVRVIAPTSAGRSAGFPQVVACGDELLFAWTDDGVRTARLRLR